MISGTQSKSGVGLRSAEVLTYASLLLERFHFPQVTGTLYLINSMQCGTSTTAPCDGSALNLSARVRNSWRRKQLRRPHLTSGICRDRSCCPTMGRKSLFPSHVVHVCVRQDSFHGGNHKARALAWNVLSLAGRVSPSNAGMFIAAASSNIDR